MLRTQLGLILCFMTLPLFAGEFPYQITPEKNIPSYQKVRFEGHSLKEFSLNPLLSIGYVRKLYSPKFTTSIEELNYFKDSAQVIKLLQHSGPNNNAPQVKLILTGDIMFVKDHWDNLLSGQVKDYLKTADLVIGNLETPIAENQKPARKFFPTTFNSPQKLIENFDKEDGTSLLTAVSLANNHLFDRGDAGAKETADYLDQKGILHSGFRLSKDEKKFKTFVINGIKFGFYATSWGYNDPKYKSNYFLNTIPGLALEPENISEVDLSETLEVLAEMKKEPIDVKIISLHWGHEFEFYPTPLTAQTARLLITNGADILYGTHPHVVQPSEVCFLNGAEKDYSIPQNLKLCKLNSPDEKKRKAMIYYSLGNFLTAMQTEITRTGVLQELTFQKTSDGIVDWFTPQFKIVFNNFPSSSNPERKLYFSTEDEVRDTKQTTSLIENFLRNGFFE